MNLALTKSRWTFWTAALGLAALMLPALTTPARAQNPVSATPATPIYVPKASNSQANTGSVGPVPFSWLQFKQQFGGTGVMSVPQYPSFDPLNANAYTNTLAYPAADGNAYPAPNTGLNLAGNYIRSYLLGDYGLNEPPGGFSNFFDEILSGVSGVVGWTAPDVNYGASSVTPIICDDDNTQNISTITGGTPVATTTTISGFATPLPSAGWGQLLAATAGQIPSDIENYYGDSYYRTIAIPRSEFPASNANPGPGAPYQYFHWYPNVTTPGAYTAYAWFPSQNATTTSPDQAHEERHVTDAEYQILINGVVVQTTTVDQQSGGTWVQIGGPFNFPVQTGAYTTDAATPPTTVTGVANPIIEIRLDNTSATLNTSNTNNEAVQGDPNSVPFVVADAIELRGEDGSTTRMLSSPVAVNKSDYPELFNGYNTTNDPDYTGAATDPGGLYPEYQQAHLVTSATAGSTGTVDATNTDVFTGIYPVGGPGTTSTGVAPTAGGSTLPIDQLVYFTRNETVVSANDPTAVQTVGAVYCVDGRNGNVVWRYPSNSPVTIPDTDTTTVPPNFSYTGAATQVGSSSTGYNGETYYNAAAVATGGGNFATWLLPAPATGTPTVAQYQIQVYLPTSTTQTFLTNVVYTINAADGIHTCYVDQTIGPGFVPLVDTNGNSTFPLLSGTNTVQVSNQPLTNPGSGPVVAADAVEFIPTGSLGTVDSSPAIVRNMRVLTKPAGVGGKDVWETRTVVIVADNLGKVYALDAAGNQDGNDTLLDANGNAVSFDAQGNPTGAPTGGYVLPYTPKQYGSTHVYWIWQPNPNSQVATQVFDDNSNTAATAGQSLFTPGPTGFTTTVTTPTAPAAPALPVTDAYPPPTGTALTDVTAVAPPTPDYVTWSPLLPAGTSLCNVYVWFPLDPNTAATTANPPTTDAHYTIVDAAGALHHYIINQAGTGGKWILLGQVTLSQTANPPTAPTGYETTANTIVLDNNSATANNTVYADAVRVDVVKPSQLITPLAFQMCSPTVSLTPTDYAAYGMTQPAAASNVPPTNDATIYIGNSNGVMYSLEGGGLFNAPPAPIVDIRRNASLDPNTPTAGVNWWFDFGGNPNDVAGKNTLGTTYAPVYDPYDGPAEDPTQDTLPLASRTPDGLLFFTTFSPQAADDGGETNQGYLFAVDAKYGPFGDGGDTGGAYTVGDPTTRVGTQKYNTMPVPYWTFPDEFGTLKTDPSIDTPTTPAPVALTLAFTYGTVTESDHIVTTKLPAIGTAPYAFQPAANPVGDSAGAPILYTASVLSSPSPFDAGNPTNDTSRRVYFAANDPNTESPSSGRIYGIDPATGELDAPSTTSYPFIYPATLGVQPTPLSTLANPYGDPNLIARTDTTALYAAYVGGSTYNYSTTDVPNAFGAFTDQDASTGYFVSSSPVAAPITFSTSTNVADLPGAVTNLPTGATGATGAGIDINPPAGTGQTVQMMYMADLSGLMHYINLTGNPCATAVPAYSSPAIDLYKDVFDYQVGDTIISTPALVPDASGAGYTTPEPAATGTPALDAADGNNVGGALFLTTEGGDIVELEAFPTIDPATSATAVRLKDWTYAGPGGYSSPIVASFNTTNVTTAATDLGDSEWIYVGGDQGTCYGFTPNNTSANGTANGGTAPPTGAPGTYIPPTDIAPPTTVPPNRNFYTQVAATAPPTTGSVPFNALQGPPLNPVFDWGQTAYIEIFGVDQPNPANANNLTPKAIRLTFTIKPVGRVGRGLRIVNKVIDLQAATGVYPITTTGGAWPPANTTLSTVATQTTAGTIVGPNVAVYAYQLGDGTNDPQTPGSKVQISNITEQVQYYDTSTPPKIITVTINGTADQGSIIRTKTANPNSLGATAAIDQATFSILNPLAVRGAGRSLGVVPALGTVAYYNLTLSPQGRTLLGQLGPFSGVNTTAAGIPGSTQAAVTANTNIFNVANAAMTNGNSLLTYAPLGGLLYAYTDTTHTNATLDTSASSTLTQVQAPPQYQTLVVASAGLISHGTEAIGSTPQKVDPPVMTGGSPNTATPPTPTSGGDYGEALLNIMDRSALGQINTPITRLRMNNPTLVWNDNSETGNGSGAVINPLPWEQLPQAFYVSGRTSSPDYPDIGSYNTSVELLPRANVGGNYSSVVDAPTSSPYAALGGGSDDYITAADVGLAPSGPDTGATRQLFPNAALIHVAIPRYQPANLESYPQAENGTAILSSTSTGGGILSPGVNHADTVNQVSANVAEGYLARGQVFIDTRGNGRRDRTEAYRSIQVWAGVPADTSTSVAETTVDIGSVPAGFGLYGTTGAGGTTVPPTNNNWSPLIPGTTAQSPYANFFKPITVINNGNVNLMNVHLDQRLTGMTSTGAADPTFPTFLPFQSDTVNNPYGLPFPPSYVPSSDYNVAAGNTLTGTPYLPLVRSNFDLFDLSSTATYSTTTQTWSDTTATNDPQFNTFVPNPLLVNGTAGTLTVPGATLHKPRPGDPAGSVMTVPDTPHNNYPNVNGSVILTNQPYQGRPVVSLAIPLGTPVGTYSDTIRAFEGYDVNSQQYQGPLYAGSPVTAIQPWGPAVPGTTPTSVLTYNTATSQPMQTASDPGTTLRATVVETRLTDGVPLPVSSTTFNTMGTAITTTTSAVLPMIDSGVATTTGPTATAVYNSNDIQPWAYFDPSGTTPVVGLLWASQRASAATNPPYGIYGTGLTSLITPTNMTGTSPSWWAPPTSLAPAASNPSVVAPVAAGGSQTALGATALWVATGTTGNQLQGANLSYTAGVPAVSNLVTLLTRTQPVFGPRGTYVYVNTTGTPVLSELTVPGTSLSSPSDPAPGNAPLIFWSTRSGGRSQILYWPAVTADPNATGKLIVSSGVLPIPSDMRSVANPTAVARYVSVNGTLLSVVDVTYTGISAATGQSDVYTSRYIVTIDGHTQPTAADAGTVTSLTLTLTPELPTTALSPAPTVAYLPTKPTITETLTNDGQNGYQSPDTGWIRDAASFELDALIQPVQVVTTTNAQGKQTSTSTIGNGSALPLIPSAFFSQTNPISRAVYDKSSGQWIFTVNWSELNAYYGSTTPSLGASAQASLLTFANWLYGTPAATTLPTTNLTIYTNPAAGTVRLGVPIPKNLTLQSNAVSATTVDNTNFVTFQAQVNPQAQRVTFRSSANVAAVSFIDDKPKTNDAPYGATGGGTVSQNVLTSREWYIYRKTAIGGGAAAATSSVLYYKTRRLTLVLPYPLQLAPSAAAALGYTVSNLRVTIGNPAVDVTQDVDVDWSRGRLYFPDVPTAANSAGYEGQIVTATYNYTYKDGTTQSGTTAGVVQWMDELQANDPGAATDKGEHVIPISNAVNESDPSAFLNPNASDTDTTTSNQSAAHSVWLFWSSSRNANGTGNGTGADLYWESIDPRFEVVPGS